MRGLKSGHAPFTQPPMPIKCAGAPQKAMYLSADHWYGIGVLKDIDIGFYNAGAVLFGVSDYVPALMDYVKRYKAALNFHHNLVAIDGPAKKAWFTKTLPDREAETVETTFDMIHVTPPQTAPDFVRVSPLADKASWVDVDQVTLRHKSFDNIYALGDVCSAPNAKTAAAARKQAPVVAENVIADMGLGRGNAIYDGYGSCPLTVERGKIVLAEFGYGGRLLPSFPRWLIDGTRPSRLASRAGGSGVRWRRWWIIPSRYPCKSGAKAARMQATCWASASGSGCPDWWRHSSGMLRGASCVCLRDTRCSSPRWRPSCPLWSDFGAGRA